jgi:hypothetical protein
MFSPRMLRHKFLPVFLEETMADNRYAPVTIPLIVQIGSTFDRRDFLPQIFSPIGKLMTVTRPPETCLSVFTVMKILLEKLEKDQHGDLLLPIYLAALQSEDPRLHNAAVKNFPLIAASLPPTSIRSVAIPKLSDLFINTKFPEIIQACIETLTFCLSYVDQDDFARIVLPKIGNAWRRVASPQIARALPPLLEVLTPSIDVTMRELVPLIAIVLSISAVDARTQLRLIAVGQRAFQRVASERTLESRENDEIEEGAHELEALPEPQQPEVLEIPQPKPVRRVVERPEPKETKRPNWSAVFKKPETESEPSAFDLPSPAPNTAGDDEVWFNSGQTQEEIDAAVVNGILDHPPGMNRR